MGKIIVTLACILGAIAVIIGAFGAHGLEGKITEVQQNTYETGVTYHFYHTLALLACGLLAWQYPTWQLRWAAIAFALGILLFSGSLYLLSCRELLGLTSWRWLGPITPIGGVGFIIGWIFFAIGAMSIKVS
ncbi:MAG: DUF423 domain-containing protein [Bacteroidota bacterium]